MSHNLSDGLGERLFSNGLNWLHCIFLTTTRVSELPHGTVVTTDLTKLVVVLESFIVVFLECAQQSLPPLHGSQPQTT